MNSYRLAVWDVSPGDLGKIVLEQGIGDDPFSLKISLKLSMARDQALWLRTKLCLDRNLLKTHFPLHAFPGLRQVVLLDRFFSFPLIAENSPADAKICDNVGDHLMGNVYARYEWEAEAGRATNELNDRWYAMRPLHCELSPVSDFREACCRQNELGTCTREG